MRTHHDPDLAHRLILRAAQRAPAPLAERLAEEWLADLQSRSGALPRLRLALGCCWATAIITRDFRVPQLATSGAGSGPRPYLAGLQQGLPVLSRRSLTFLLIAAIHILLIYAFATGLAQQVVTSIPEVLHATFSEPVKPQRASPATAPSEYTLKRINFQTPPLDPPRKFEYQTEETPVLAKPGDPDAGPGTGVTVTAPHRVLGGPGTGFPNTDDYYPAASRRLSETGAATVQVCVDTRGRLTADPTLARSSGSRRIDAGALNLARAGSGYYRPSTEEGQPVNSCYPYRIRFELN